jgi:hypothetical protein
MSGRTRNHDEECDHIDKGKSQMKWARLFFANPALPRLARGQNGAERIAGGGVVCLKND